MPSTYVVIISNVLAVLTGLLVSVSSDCDVDTLRCCITDFLTLVSAENGFQLTEKNINDVCRTQHQAVTCLETYDSQCITNSNAQFREHIVQTDAQIAALCKSPSESPSVRNGTCLSQATPELKECAAKYENTTQDRTEDANWINACCEYKGVKECAVRLATNKCPEEVSKDVEKLVSSLNGLGYELWCKDEHYSSCYNVAVKPVSTILYSAVLSLCLLAATPI